MTAAKEIDISVILNLHREAKYVRRTLRSLTEAIAFAEYRGSRIELLIILDKTDDVTRKAVSAFDFMLLENVVIHEVSHGSLGGSRNAGVALATGKYIATADADDLISFNYLSAMIDTITALNDNVVLVPQYFVGFGDNYHLCEYFGTDVLSKLLLFDSHPYVSRIFAAASLFRKIPYVALDRSSSFAYEDWHFNCEAVARGCEIAIAPETSVYYRQRPGSMLRNADAESLKCIPPSLYFEPETYLAVMSDHMNNPPRSGGQNYLWQEIRKKFEDHRVNLELIAVANAVDPAVNYGLPDSFAVFSYLDRSDALGRAYYSICETVKEQRFTDVFLVPFLVVGGGDKYVIEVMNGIARLGAERRILVLGLQPCAEQSWLHRIPENALFIDVGKICEGLGPRSYELLVLRMLQTCARGARLYIKSAETTLHFYQKYCKVLGEHQTTYFRFMDLVRSTHDYHWMLGFDFDFMSNCGEHLSYIICDNDAVRRRDQNSLDQFAHKMHVLHAYCHVPDTYEALRTDSRKLIWASRLDHQKRPDLIMKLARKLADLHPDIAIDVYGSAVLDAFDINEFSTCSNIAYCGPFENFDALPLQDYAGFLYTSDYDGLPNVVLEAMANGLSVIAPDVGGIAEAVNADNGYIVKPSQNDGVYVDNYIRAIEDLFGDDEIRVAKSKAARQLIVDRHSMTAYLAQLDEIYRITAQVTKKPRKPDDV